MAESAGFTICSICKRSRTMDSMVSVVSLGYSVCFRCFIISEAMNISASLHGIRDRSQKEEIKRANQRNVALFQFANAVLPKLSASEEVEWINSTLHTTNRKFEEIALRLGLECFSASVKEESCFAE